MSVAQRVFAAICEYTSPADPIESLRGTFVQWTHENGEEVVVTKEKKKGFRPDLNHYLQNARYAVDKERARLKYLNHNSCEMGKTEYFSRVAVKGLLDEAYRLYTARQKEDDEEAFFFEFRWWTLANDIMKNFEASGPQSVIAHLSCMSLFVAGHEAESYGPNTESRMLIVERRKIVIQQIKLSSARVPTVLDT